MERLLPTFNLKNKEFGAFSFPLIGIFFLIGISEVFLTKLEKIDSRKKLYNKVNAYIGNLSYKSIKIQFGIKTRA